MSHPAASSPKSPHLTTTAATSTSDLSTNLSDWNTLSDSFPDALLDAIFEETCDFGVQHEALRRNIGNQSDIDEWMFHVDDGADMVHIGTDMDGMGYLDGNGVREMHDVERQQSIGTETVQVQGTGMQSTHVQSTATETTQIQSTAMEPSWQITSTSMSTVPSIPAGPPTHSLAPLPQPMRLMTLPPPPHTLPPNVLLIMPRPLKNTMGVNTVVSNKRKRTAMESANLKRNRTEMATQTFVSDDALPAPKRTQYTQTLHPKFKEGVSVSIQTKQDEQTDKLAHDETELVGDLLLGELLECMRPVERNGLDAHASSTNHSTLIAALRILPITSVALFNSSAKQATTAVLQNWTSPKLTTFTRLPILIRNKKYRVAIRFNNHDNEIWFNEVTVYSPKGKKAPQNPPPFDFSSPPATAIGHPVQLHTSLRVINMHTNKDVTSTQAQTSPHQFIRFDKDTLHILQHQENILELSLEFLFHGSFLAATNVRSTQEASNHLVLITFTLVSYNMPLASSTFTCKPRVKFPKGDAVEKTRGMRFELAKQKTINIGESRVPLPLLPFSISLLTYVDLSNTNVTDCELKYGLAQLHGDTLRSLILNGCQHVRGVVQQGQSSVDFDTSLPANIHHLRCKGVPLQEEAIYLMTHKLPNLDWSSELLQDLGFATKQEILERTR